MKEYTKSYYLSAGECNPESEMPVPLLMSRLIEIATLHANEWGVGYERLIAENHAWVLTRVTIEMERYPRVNEHYSLTTWIEDYNRHFSQRNMAICDGSGNPIGYARTVWMVIDLTTRQSVDISALSYIRENISPRQCPIVPQGRIAAVTSPTRTADHTFGYAECDFNRHVNTVRYVELLLNRFDLSVYDNSFVRRFEVAFGRETHYGDTATVLVDDASPDNVLMSVDVNGQPHVKARMVFAPR